MNPEDDQQLWELLGKAKAPELSPFFARNVVRQIRQDAASRPSFLRWLRPRVLAPAAVFATAVMFAGITLERSVRNRSTDLPREVAAVDPQDYEVVADLDDLTAADDDNLWDDDSSPL
ncbi:MAG: hypothetical protein M3Y86_00585 [Verrucomicrobiota bacterium]|nr:hypothetical protein [Verrucomicrobiota bacterium]